MKKLVLIISSLAIVVLLALYMLRGSNEQIPESDLPIQQTEEIREEATGSYVESPASEEEAMEDTASTEVIVEVETEGLETDPLESETEVTDTTEETLNITEPQTEMETQGYMPPSADEGTAGEEEDM